MAPEGMTAKICREREMPQSTIAIPEAGWHDVAMSIELMECEIAELKQRMDKLEAKAKPVAKTTWRDAVGAMKDCDLLDEAVRLGAQWRDKANTEGR